MFDAVHLIGTVLPRKVARWYPDILWRRATTSKVAYFTFDDAPTSEMSTQLLDVLNRHQAKATFFVVGNQAERDPGLVRAILEAGHVLGNHSYSHPDAWRISETRMLAELEKTTRILEDTGQQPVRWMRPPYGHFTRAMRTWCQLRRQRCTMWDIGPGDYLPNVTRHQIEQRVLTSLRPGSIIVLHDNPKAQTVTPAALSNLLAHLTSEGWTFSAL